MLSHGDEVGRTQRGNNNAYCQDNELTWVDWERRSNRTRCWNSPERSSRLRAEHPVFRRRRFFHGAPPTDGESELPDIQWFTPEGAVMSQSDWAAGFAKSLAVFLNGLAIAEPDVWGQPVRDDSFLLLFNAHHEPLPFRLPPASHGELWQSVLDSAMPVFSDRPTLKCGRRTVVDGRSLVVLKRAI